MKQILESTKYVIDNAHAVRINKEVIHAVAATFQAADFDRTAFGEEFKLNDQATTEEYIAHVMVYNTINFSYWGEPNWVVTYQGEESNGSYGLMLAIRRALDEGYNLHDATYVATISEEELRHILRGTAEIPLFSERLQLLRTLGKTIQNQYQGSFSKVIEIAQGNAEEIVHILTSTMPTIWHDIATYKGKTIYFWKRAQLVPAFLSDLKNAGYIDIPITNIDGLTAFADYGVPRRLRALGILEYTPELAGKIDAQQEIPTGSEEEIEIRAATIWAVELLTQQLKETFPHINAMTVDGALWRKQSGGEQKPYHRTRSIWY